MKKILILGAGLVAKPIARYLLEKGYFVTLTSLDLESAQAILQNHPNSKAVIWTADNDKLLDDLVAGHDLVVSLLPYRLHTMVAKKAIKHKKNMVTTSYVQPEMRKLEQEVKEAGILILNEVGLDPGIDHMSAKKIIDDVHSKGGEIEEFYSITGALPALEVAAQNPFKYKFSWSPIGVLLAGNNDAHFLYKGTEIYVPTEHLFRMRFYSEFPQIGVLEIYPNRDSVSYQTLYDIPEAKTVFRGTFRYPGWSDIMDSMKRLGLFTEEEIDATNVTYRQFIASRIGVEADKELEAKVAKFLGQPNHSLTIRAMHWLGLFDDGVIGRKDKIINITGQLMIDKMMLTGDERDMVAMMHLFKVKWQDGSREIIRSSMLEFGTPNTDTSIARTVSLTAAAAVTLIMEGKINLTGIHIPVIPELYNPILERLETMNIKMSEEFGLPETLTLQ